MKSNAIFNHVLTRTASQYAVNEAEYAAPALAPVFPVAVQAATFPVWLRENLLTVPDLKARAPGAPYVRLDMELGDDTFYSATIGPAAGEVCHSLMVVWKWMPGSAEAQAA